MGEWGIRRVVRITFALPQLLNAPHAMLFILPSSNCNWHQEKSNSLSTVHKKIALQFQYTTCLRDVFGTAVHFPGC